MVTPISPTATSKTSTTPRFGRLCSALLWLAIGLYTFLALRLTFHLHDTVFGFKTGFDLSIFDQATWLISRGQRPFVTVRGLHILADHFSVILYLLAPLYWIWDSPKTLLTAQTIAISLGALPIYTMARERTGSTLSGLIFALSYLLYPVMQWSNTYEFHPDTFATPLFLAAFLYLTRRNWFLYGVMLGLAVLTKETVGLTVMALGIYVLLQIDRRAGWLTLGFGGLALVVALVTIRYFNGGVSSGYYWLYGKYGSSISGIVQYLLTHPIEVAADLNTDGKQEYLFILLCPLMFLPLLSPEVVLIAAPALLVNLLSSRSIMHNHLGGYYAAAIMPFFFVAAIIGYDRLRRYVGAFGGTVVGVNLCIWSLLSIWHGALWQQYQTVYVDSSMAPAEKRQRISEALQMLGTIPPHASVSAQITLLSHLSHRRTLYTFPNPFVRRSWGNTMSVRREMETGANSSIMAANLDKAITQAQVQYVAFCPSTGTFPLSRGTLENSMLEVIKNRSYGIVSLGTYTILLRRNANHQHGLSLLEKYSEVPIKGKRGIDMAFRKWLESQPLLD